MKLLKFAYMQNVFGRLVRNLIVQFHVDAGCSRRVSECVGFNVPLDT